MNAALYLLKRAALVAVAGQSAAGLAVPAASSIGTVLFGRDSAEEQGQEKTRGHNPPLHLRHRERQFNPGFVFLGELHCCSSGVD